MDIYKRIIKLEELCDNDQPVATKSDIVVQFREILDEISDTTDLSDVKIEDLVWVGLLYYACSSLP